LCPKAEAYVNQDVVKKNPKEILLGDAIKEQPISSGLGESHTIYGKMPKVLPVGVLTLVDTYSLTERQREIFNLYHKQGLTLRQIGLKLNISFQTVHRQLRAAKKKLKKRAETT